MSIVRSLLIKVGFANDRQSESNANRSINRFKSRALLAASAIGYAFGRVASYFNDFANNILDTDLFAKHIGIAIEDLYALQKAAQKVARIEEKDFQTAIGNIHRMFHDLKVGASGELQAISDSLGIQLDRVNDNGATIFNKILTALSQVEDASQRSRIAENIFKGVDYKKFASLAGNMTEFASATKEFASQGKEVGESLGTLNDYVQAVNSLNQAWQSFVVTIAKDVIPVLTQLLGPLEQVFELAKVSGNFYKTIFQGNLQGFKDNLKEGSRLLDPVFESIANAAKGTGRFLSSALEDYGKPAFQSVVDYVENKEGYSYSNGISNPMGSPNVTINNEITVPNGTTEDQAKFIADSIQRTIEDSIQSTFMQIQYNNPVVE